jgi:hypothetical protein
MSNGVKKRWDRLIVRKVTLRTLGALAAGLGIVYVFVTLLSLYGTSSDSLPLLASQPAKFPENEQALDDMAAELARQGAALSKVEPAAGTRAQKPELKK